jgi:hypothetical protein
MTTLRLCAKSVISAVSAPKASDDPEEEQLFRDLWEDETQREVVMESLKADCGIRTGRPPGLWGTDLQRSKTWVSALRSLFLVARLYRPYHPKVLTLQWPPARRTILYLLGVRLAVLEVIEEYPTVFLSDPPELPPEPMPLRARAVENDHRL